MHCYVVMNMKSSYGGQNHFYQAIKYFYMCCKVGHFNIGSMETRFLSHSPVVIEATVIFLSKLNSTPEFRCCLRCAATRSTSSVCFWSHSSSSLVTLTWENKLDHCLAGTSEAKLGQNTKRIKYKTFHFKCVLLESAIQLHSTLLLCRVCLFPLHCCKAKWT